MISYDFAPMPALIGGVLIGLSASLLLLFNGKVAGISGILGGLIRRPDGESVWRASFIAGLLAGGILFVTIAPSALRVEIDRSVGALAVAGLLVGFGTRLGSGCTSGHGVCGIARFSKRSLVATITFMATAAAVVFVINHVLEGRL